MPRPKKVKVPEKQETISSPDVSDVESEEEAVSDVDQEDLDLENNLNVSQFSVLEDENAPEPIQSQEEKVEKDRLKDIRRNQREALKKLKSEQKSELEKESAKNKKDRLKFLLQQTEIFTHFVHSGQQRENKPKESTNTSKRTSKRKSKRNLDEEDEEILKSAISEGMSEGTRLLVQPSCVKGEMRSYQLQGLNWLIKLYENGINGILADEMGLGKTYQALSLLAYLKEVRRVKGPHLVIVPKSTIANWIKEIKRWTPCLKPLKFHGDKDKRAEIRQKELILGKFDVCVTSYEMAIKERAALRQFSWRYLVIDEAHRIKNEKSLFSTVVRIFNSQFRLLITGTPLQNNLHELWALLNFLLPDVFSSSEDFDNWFDLKGAVNPEDQRKVIEKLHKVLRPFLLRRLKAEVEKDLPPKQELHVPCPLSSKQKKWYKNILTRDIGAIVDQKKNRVRLCNIVMQLRKVCNHPYLFEGAEPGPPFVEGEHIVDNCGKMQVLDRLLKRLKEKGHRVLIFSQMTRVLDILEDYINMRGWEYCRIDGQTDGDLREEQIESYNAPKSSKFIFLLSTRAGGLGINLATADTVILYDSDWNPQLDLQAQDRAHRIGQTKPVTVYRLVTRNSLEIKILERAQKKLHLDALVIQQGRLVEQSQGLSTDEMLNMIQYGADQIINNNAPATEDDDLIDLEKIMQEAEELTNENNSKIQRAVLDFSMGEGNLYEFEGADFSGFHKLRTQDLLALIPNSKRERKQQTYSVNEYYKTALKVGTNTKKSEPKPPKQPNIHDFQFYDPRLHELIQRENKAFQQSKKRDEEEMDQEPVEALTTEELEEKERLLKTGFGNWNKRDFQAFLRAIEKHGRSASAETLAADIEGKTVDEIDVYSKHFWANYKRLNDWERILKNLEKTESKRKRIEEMEKVLSERISKYSDPLKNMRLHYQGNQAKHFTPEEDIYLLVFTNQHGYGNWEKIKLSLRQAWQFRFDWFFKSRTTQELQRRVDLLIRCIEKENQDHSEKLEKLNQLKKKASESGQGKKKLKTESEQ